ncbi:MAG: hypothetical protein DHS20C02_10830 [Micavibrio sp.]|nr:MAG: hypothetical protein DHS20C02_10830 [Micavibrio sp.]
MFRKAIINTLIRTAERFLGEDSQKGDLAQQNFDKNSKDDALLKKIHEIMILRGASSYRLINTLPSSILRSDTPHKMADRAIAAERSFDSDIASLLNETGATTSAHKTELQKKIRAHIRPSEDGAQDRVKNLRLFSKRADKEARRLLKIGKHGAVLKRRGEAEFNSLLNQSKLVMWVDALILGAASIETAAQGFYGEVFDGFATDTQKKRAEKRAEGIKKAKLAQQKKKKVLKHPRRKKKAPAAEPTPRVKSADEIVSELESILQDTKEEIETLTASIVQASEALDEEGTYLVEVKKENKIALDEVKPSRREAAVLFGEKATVLRLMQKRGHPIDEHETPQEEKAIILNGEKEEKSDPFSTLQNATLTTGQYKDDDNSDLVNYQDMDDVRIIGLINQIKEKRKERFVLECDLAEINNKVQCMKEHVLQTQKQTAGYNETLGRLEDIKVDLNIEIAQLNHLLDNLKSERGVSQVFLRAAQYPPLSELGQWAESNLQDRVIIHPAALKNVAQSEYGDPDVIYRSMELLANGYWNRKMSGSESREEAKRLQDLFTDELTSLQMTFGKSLTLINKRIIPSYQVTYNGRKVFLDQHLGKGSSYDPKRCLRIYFNWDNEANQVLVGHLPDHLPCVCD